MVDLNFCGVCWRPLWNRRWTSHLDNRKCKFSFKAREIMYSNVIIYQCVQILYTCVCKIKRWTLDTNSKVLTEQIFYWDDNVILCSVLQLQIFIKVLSKRKLDSDESRQKDIQNWSILNSNSLVFRLFPRPCCKHPLAFLEFTWWSSKLWFKDCCKHHHYYHPVNIL